MAIMFSILNFYRGYVHCLKLSPNLRKQTKEYKTAMINEEDKTSWSCEVKQLRSILDMVRDPDAVLEEAFCKEDEEDSI